MTQPSEQKRDYLFDNIKAVMLFLVVVGHILDPFIVRQDSLYRYLMQYIYLFHMPMFAFVTGYFSKNVEKARSTAARNVLVPYMFWQILYIIMALISMKAGLASYNTEVFKPSLLLPSSPLYYLLCVFMWKVFIKDIASLKRPVLFSVFAGLLVSLVFDKAFHIGWGACLSLLLFFVLGFYCTPEHVARIRTIPKAVSLLILAGAVIPSVFLPYHFRNVRFTYADAGLDPLMGIVYRAMFYCIAVLMIGALINIFPTGKNSLSRVGRNGLLVYAGSSFAAPALYLVFARFVPVADAVWSNLAAMCLFAYALVLFCSMDWIKNIYDRVIGQIERMLFK